MIKNPYIEREPKEFMEGLETNQFNNGLSKADFIWNYFGNKYQMEFLAGFVGIKQDKKTLTLRPEIGWLVKDKKNKIKTKFVETKNSSEIDEKTNSNWKTYSIAFTSIFLFVLFIFYKSRKNKSRN